MFLRGHADFALGIVTGDNGKYVTGTPSPGSERVLKGKDIFRYRIRPSESYITFRPESFQQVAPEALYRAPEKLLYRFISSQLVFACDDAGTLSLNSCNVVIPRLEGLSVRFVMAVLNSRIAQFIFTREFRSVKVLRSHIESIPIPVTDKTQQQEIQGTIRLIEKEDDKAERLRLYNDLDLRIASLFSLSDAEYQVILNSLGDRNLFLARQNRRGHRRGFRKNIHAGAA